MSKKICTIQQSVKNLRQEINDILHLSYLNKQSIMCLMQQNPQPFNQIELNRIQITQQNQILNIQKPCKQSSTNPTNILKLKHQQFQKKFDSLSKLFQKRCQNHLNYLIVNQIKWEQQSVRRDRLIQYEDRIYDQRRLISDKQVFCQNLLRPKKKRPQSMPNQDFLQMRLVEKQQQQALKLSLLEDQIKQLSNFRKKTFQIDRKVGKGVSEQEIIKRQQESYKKIKNNSDLQKTQANSIEIVNNTNNTLNNVTLGDKGSKNIIQDEQQPASTIQKFKQLKQLDQEPIKEPVTSSIEQIQKSLAKMIQRHSQSSSLSQQRRQQTFKAIKNLLQNIKTKKEQNNKKSFQLTQLKQQNDHMKDQVKKQRENYQQQKNVYDMKIKENSA